MAYQQGSIYLYKGTWFLKYRTAESKVGTAHGTPQDGSSAGNRAAAGETAAGRIN
jgi:hypothetical protein